MNVSASASWSIRAESGDKVQEVVDDDIGPDRRVINVAANATPYSEDQIWSEAPAIAVLELNGGRAAELGIGPGASVSW